MADKVSGDLMLPFSRKEVIPYISPYEEIDGLLLNLAAAAARLPQDNRLRNKILAFVTPTLAIVEHSLPDTPLVSDECQ